MTALRFLLNNVSCVLKYAYLLKPANQIDSKYFDMFNNHELQGTVVKYLSRGKIVNDKLSLRKVYC